MLVTLHLWMCCNISGELHLKCIIVIGGDDDCNYSSSNSEDDGDDDDDDDNDNNKNNSNSICPLLKFLYICGVIWNTSHCTVLQLRIWMIFLSLYKWGAMTTLCISFNLSFINIQRLLTAAFYILWSVSPLQVISKRTCKALVSK